MGSSRYGLIAKPVALVVRGNYSSPIEELPQVRAKIYLAQGVDDDALDPASSDALYAHLRARGKDVVYDRIEGDHSFQRKAAPKADGWQEQMSRIVTWFIGK
jgi:predicted esterase